LHAEELRLLKVVDDQFWFMPKNLSSDN